MASPCFHRDVSFILSEAGEIETECVMFKATIVEAAVYLCFVDLEIVSLGASCGGLLWECGDAALLIGATAAIWALYIQWNVETMLFMGSAKILSQILDLYLKISVKIEITEKSIIVMLRVN